MRQKAAWRSKIISDGPKHEPEPCGLGVHPSTPQQGPDHAQTAGVPMSLFP